MDRERRGMRVTSTRAMTGGSTGGSTGASPLSTGPSRQQTGKPCGGAFRPRAAALAVAAAALMALGACEPTVRVHGYAPAEAQLALLEPGIDSAATVTTKIGRPSTAGVMRNDAWYYVSSRVETLAYKAPEVTERRIVAVRFDDAGMLASADVFGLEDGRIINLVTRTTPTFGREMTILQQVFGNLANAGASLAENAANSTNSGGGLPPSTGP